MNIVNFISNFFMNHHLLKLDINNDFIKVLLIISIIYTCSLFMFGMSIRKVSILHTILQFTYCILNTIFLLFIFGLFAYLLGNAGIITFMILFFSVGLYKLLDVGLYKLLEITTENTVYVFNVGRLVGWVCDNYESKKKFYKGYNNEYNKFKQYNEEII